jgi:hypothetical protein
MLPTSRIAESASELQKQGFFRSPS